MKNDQVEMYLDCEKVQSVKLEPRGRIDVNGNMQIAKQEEDGKPVQVIINKSVTFTDTV